MDLKDVFGIGKILPIDKLIDVVTNSVGRLSKSYFDKKDVDTKAYEIKMLAEARANELEIISRAVHENFKITGTIEYKEERLAITSPQNKESIPKALDTLEGRTKERIDFQEGKKQLNIESITAFAAEDLKDEPPVNNEPLDEDWTTRFFRIAEDVSNEEMQALWGKILAGEVQHPKSYSLRTLELIRNLSKREADVFMKVANLAIKSGHGHYIFKGNDDDKLNKEFDVSYMDIAVLKEIGIIQPGEFANHQLLPQPNDSQRVLIAGRIIILVNLKANTPVEMPVEVFTNAGNELMRLIKSTPPIDYLRYLAGSIQNKNVDVKYANIVAFEGDNIRHTEPLMEF